MIKLKIPDGIEKVLAEKGKEPVFVNEKKGLKVKKKLAKGYEIVKDSSGRKVRIGCLLLMARPIAAKEQEKKPEAKRKAKPSTED